MSFNGILPLPLMAGELLSQTVELVPLENKRDYFNHHECPPPQFAPASLRRVIQPKPQHGNRVGKRG